MKTIVIDPVTRIEGHAKITIRLDDAGGWPTPSSTSPSFAVSRNSPKGAFLRNARDYRAHLRHLSDQPLAGLGQGVRRDHEREGAAGGGEAARAAALGQITQSHALSFFLLSGPDFSARLRVRYRDPQYGSD